MKALLGLTTAVVCLSAPTAATAQPLPAWMTGAWERVEGESWADEYWTPPKAGIMIGASRSGDGEKLLFWEHMRIVREDDGNLAFWAISADQRPVRFGAVRVDQSEILFENPAHDYPQRIRYWHEQDMLKAEIALIDGTKAVQFLFARLGG